MDSAEEYRAELIDWHVASDHPSDGPCQICFERTLQDVGMLSESLEWYAVYDNHIGTRRDMGRRAREALWRRWHRSHEESTPTTATPPTPEESRTGGEE